MKRICFLFNHDQTHQLAHSLPIAVQMLAQGGNEIVLAYTSDAIGQELARLGGVELAGASMIRLGLKSPVARFAAVWLDSAVPATKALLYRDNLDFFRSFDALVVSEKTSLLLKTRYGLDRLTIIHTRHGAGDRAIGFNRQSALFDLVLVPGDKIRQRLIKEAGLAPDRIAICGYPKFDLCADNRFADSFPEPHRPVVLYNPHPSPKLSSWHRHGRAVLDAFVGQDRYNLIFAPHVMLFARKWTVTIDPPAVARVQPPGAAVSASSHIHLDLGSGASSDMSYTNRADLYLGDVSSQVYEFLRAPRPCLFLNSHNLAWRNDPNYLHWTAGPVIETPDRLIEAIDRAFASQAEYRAQQYRLLDDTFSVSPEPSALRAARAIEAFLATDGDR
ncbi:hypothetical protein [Blastomonas sp.]|uniref:hypothetical protein n=1 Tax=Blastomonas sp. TaxID=1909299 RepID=UPI002604BBB4|nr:hypothetical protein [Blastomonas sp.]MDM7957025.1 hypothetical protein [Blastomonas sp.]